MIKVGDKIKGFKFEDSSFLSYSPTMNKYINVTGVVSAVYIPLGKFHITFPDGNYWTYPLNHPKSVGLSKLKYKLK